ncbi:hypothetical protein ACPA9J_28775 [Pseudomonas aeruginosa]
MIPLILATGAGAVSRFDIGIVIATGMSVGTPLHPVRPAVHLHPGGQAGCPARA